MFVAELASGRTVSEAAAKAGISKRTAARWHRDPDVVAALDRMRTATLSHARDVLLGMIDEAAGWLRRAGNSDSPAAVASAARCVFTQASRYQDMTAIEEQLDELRQAVARIEAAGAPGRWVS
jgi:hypothetical protein